MKNLWSVQSNHSIKKKIDKDRFFKVLSVASSTLPPLSVGEEIYDLRSWVHVPFPWAATILTYACYILLFWLAYKLLIRRRRRVEQELSPVSPPPNPLEEALSALELLRNSPLWQSNQIKDIIEHLTKILKTYLHNRFHFAFGSASTTDELISALENSRSEIGCLNRIHELLNLCDSVKFAKGTLGSTTIDEVFERTRDLILSEGWQAP